MNGRTLPLFESKLSPYVFRRFESERKECPTAKPINGRTGERKIPNRLQSIELDSLQIQGLYSDQTACLEKRMPKACQSSYVSQMDIQHIM
ncbi:hypothetical protein M8J77_011971 [Diaphorina citri]|nr:hypothetical protein M8J77_011971 [Diaphorina citri]